MKELFSYAFAMLVEVRIEGEHARIHNIGQQACTGKLLPASVSASLRSKDTVSLLDQGPFTGYLQQHWHGKYGPHCMKSLLSHLFNRAQLSTMTVSTVLGHIYMYDIAVQFSDVSAQRQLSMKWNAEVAKVKRCIIEPLADHERLMLQYFKARFHVGAVFSTRAALMNAGMDDDVVRLNGFALWEAIELADLSLDRDKCLARDGIAFFEVVNPHPERKLGPTSLAHAERVHCMHIKLLELISVDGECFVVESASSETTVLNFRPWLSRERLPEALSSLLYWAFIPENKVSPIVIRWPLSQPAILDEAIMCHSCVDIS